MRFEDQWQQYVSKVYNNLSVNSTQYRETQQAFYAGGFCIINVLISLLDMSTKEPTEQDIENFNKIKDEIDAFLMTRAIEQRYKNKLIVRPS